MFEYKEEPTSIKGKIRFNLNLMKKCGFTDLEIVTEVIEMLNDLNADKEW